MKRLYNLLLFLIMGVTLGFAQNTVIRDKSEYQCGLVCSGHRHASDSCFIRLAKNMLQQITGKDSISIICKDSLYQAIKRQDHLHAYTFTRRRESFPRRHRKRGFSEKPHAITNYFTLSLINAGESNRKVSVSFIEKSLNDLSMLSAFVYLQWMHANRECELKPSREEIAKSRLLFERQDFGLSILTQDGFQPASIEKVSHDRLISAILRKEENMIPMVFYHKESDGKSFETVLWDCRLAKAIYSYRWRIK